MPARPICPVCGARPVAPGARHCSPVCLRAELRAGLTGLTVDLPPAVLERRAKAAAIEAERRALLRGEAVARQRVREQEQQLAPEQFRHRVALRVRQAYLQWVGETLEAACCGRRS